MTYRFEDELLTMIRVALQVVGLLQQQARNQRGCCRDAAPSPSNRNLKKAHIF